MKKLFLFAFLVCTINLSAQINEICNDGADNDLDHLVDCADPDCILPECESAFPCQNQSQLYQIRNGNDLWLWDGSNWVDVAGWSNPGNTQINAMGYNVQDGFIYGIRPNVSPNHLIRITATGLVNLGPVSGLPQLSWHTGDCDLDGNLYVSNNSQTVMYKIDLSTLTATQINLTGIPGGLLDLSDWTYVAAVNRFYGLTRNTTTTQLRSINLDGSHHSDSPVSTTNLCPGGFGGMFSDANGHIYGYCNAGQFYEITPDATFSNFTLNQISTNDQSMSQNDGAGCPLSNGLSSGGDDCCKEVLAILQSMQNQSGEREQNTAVKPSKSQMSAENEPDEPEQVAVLFQNTPNPFSEETVIRYEIKKKGALSASIHVFDLNGKLRLSKPVPLKKRGEFTIKGNSLESGMYLYTLIVDNVASDTKRMILLEN